VPLYHVKRRIAKHPERINDGENGGYLVILFKDDTNRVITEDLGVCVTTPFLWKVNRFTMSRITSIGSIST